MKRILSLLLLLPCALNAMQYNGIILCASMQSRDKDSHQITKDHGPIRQVRIKKVDSGWGWQVREDERTHYSSDLYAIAIALKSVTPYEHTNSNLDTETYPELNIECVITDKKTNQTDTMKASFNFFHVNMPRFANLTLKDDAGNPIILILNPQLSVTPLDK